MILVTTGINGAPFDRLLRVVDDLETTEELVVQRGPSTLALRRARAIGFLPFDELGELVSSASTVITHAGVGSVLLAFMHGKSPIVVPRLPQHGEVVDDHQLLFARHLGAAGLVDLAEDPREIVGLLEHPRRSARIAATELSALGSDLSAYLHAICRSARPEPAAA
jgi:UDP-N-acetylglucosamine transferase subunit ALG13